MRVIIPLAGRGSRLRPATDIVPKSLLEYRGRTILSYILESLQVLDISEYIFVVGYRGQQVRDYVAANYSDLRVVFVEQSDLKGVGDAIFQVRGVSDTWLDNNPILIVLGDVIVDTDWKLFVACQRSVVGVQTVWSKKPYGIAFGIGDRVSRFQEKPVQVDSKLAGCYLIHEVNVFFECLEKIMTNCSKTDGEYQLTDALDLMLCCGVHIFRREVELVDWEREYR